MGLTAKPQDGQNIGAFGGPQWVWVPEVGIGITLRVADVHIKHLAQFLTQKNMLRKWLFNNTVIPSNSTISECYGPNSHQNVIIFGDRVFKEVINLK